MRKNIRVLTVIAMFALALVPTGAVFAQGSGPGGGQVVFGQNMTIESGDTFTGDLVVFGGNVDIEKDARLRGNLIVFGGQVASDGEVAGDLVIIGGQASLDKDAVVSGDVVTIGGQLERAEGAVVEGDVVNNIKPEITIPSVQVPVEPKVTIPEVVRVTFNPFLEFGRTLVVSLLMAFLAILTTLFFQDRLSRVADAVIRQPLTTGSIGLLTIVALILVAITIILLPVAILGLIPLALAWLFGVVALGQEIGERLARAIQQNWTSTITAGLGTFVLAFLLVSVRSLNDLLPFMVCVTWIIPVFVGLLAIGSVVITRFGARPVQIPILNAPKPPSNPGQEPPSGS